MTVIAGFQCPKPLLVAILLISIPPLVLSCGNSRQAQPSAATPESHPENEMSRPFREQGYRAFDAIQRVPSVGSKEYPQPGFALRELDAEKAIDEAKYKAQTAKDKEVLDLLWAALFGRTGAEKRSLLNPDHMKFFQMGDQCLLELRAEFESANLTELGLKTAREKTCLSQHEAILSEMERRQRRSLSK